MHSIPDYPDYDFWTTLRVAYTGSTPSDLLTDIGQIVIETLREHETFFRPRYLFTKNGPPQRLLVLAQRRLEMPRVELTYVPGEGEAIERVHFKILPRNHPVAQAYQVRFRTYIAPLADFEFNIIAHEFIVTRPEYDISSSSGYPSGIGIEDEEESLSSYDDDSDEFEDPFVD